MIHELKQAPEYFNAVIEGRKLFEVRKNDRPFKVGDMLALNEFESGYYTGRSCLVYVDYIFNDKTYCKTDFIVMSIKPCMVARSTAPHSWEKMSADYRVMLATEADKKGGESDA